MLLGHLRYPIAVLSDLHLGHPASYLKRPELLQPLFDGVRTAVFNGDTVELMNLRRRGRALRLLGELTAACRASEVTPILVSGNHDPQASSLHSLELVDGRVFLTHGDALHPDVAPWSRDAFSLRQERHRLEAKQAPPARLEELLLLSKKTSLVASIYDHGSENALRARMHMVSKFVTHPWRIALAFHYWHRTPHYAVQLRDRYMPQARLMVIGHTHRAGVWHRHGLTLVNTGSFQPLSRPLLVEIEPRQATVFEIHHLPGGYYRGRTLRRIRL